MKNTPAETEAIRRALAVFTARNELIPEIESKEFVWGLLGDDSQERFDTIIAMAEIAIGLAASITDPAIMFAHLGSTAEEL